MYLFIRRTYIVESHLDNQEKFESALYFHIFGMGQDEDLFLLLDYI